MSKPSESTPAREPRRIRPLLAVAALALAGSAGALLLRPAGAAAGLADRAPPPPASPAPSAAARAPATYQLRCWQYGRLLFDEGPVTLGAEARQGARMVAFDRNGAALIVTEAGEATCVARPSAPPPSLALPR